MIRIMDAALDFVDDDDDDDNDSGAYDFDEAVAQAQHTHVTVKQAKAQAKAQARKRILSTQAPTAVHTPVKNAATAESDGAHTPAAHAARRAARYAEKVAAEMNEVKASGQPPGARRPRTAPTARPRSGRTTTAADATVPRSNGGLTNDASDLPELDALDVVIPRRDDHDYDVPLERCRRRSARNLVREVIYHLSHAGILATISQAAPFLYGKRGFVQLVRHAADHVNETEGAVADAATRSELCLICVDRRSGVQDAMYAAQRLLATAAIALVDDDVVAKPLDDEGSLAWIPSPEEAKALIKDLRFRAVHAATNRADADSAQLASALLAYLGLCWLALCTWPDACKVTADAFLRNQFGVELLDVCRAGSNAPRPVRIAGARALALMGTPAGQGERAREMRSEICEAGAARIIAHAARCVNGDLGLAEKVLDAAGSLCASSARFQRAFAHPQFADGATVASRIAATCMRAHALAQHSRACASSAILCVTCAMEPPAATRLALKSQHVGGEFTGTARGRKLDTASMVAISMEALDACASAAVAVCDANIHQTIRSILRPLEESPGIVPNDFEAFKLLALQEAREKFNNANTEEAFTLTSSAADTAVHKENTPRVATVYYIVQAQRNSVMAMHALCATPRGRAALVYTAGNSMLNECLARIIPSPFGGTLSGDVRLIAYDACAKMVDASNGMPVRELPPHHVLDRLHEQREPNPLPAKPTKDIRGNMPPSTDNETMTDTMDTMCENLFRRVAVYALLLLPRHSTVSTPRPTSALDSSAMDRQTAIAICARGSDGGAAGVRDSQSKLSTMLRKREVSGWSAQEAEEEIEGLHSLRAVHMALRNSLEARSGATTWYGKGSLMRMLATIFLHFSEGVATEPLHGFRLEVCRQAAMCMELMMRVAQNEHWIYAMIQLSKSAEDAELALASASTGASLPTAEARKDATLAHHLLQRVISVSSCDDVLLRHFCTLMIGTWMGRCSNACHAASNVGLLKAMCQAICSEAETRVVHLTQLRVAAGAALAEKRYWRWRGAILAALARCAAHFYLGQKVDRAATEAFVEGDGALAVAALLASGASHLASTSAVQSASPFEDDVLGGTGGLSSDERETPEALAVVELCRVAVQLSEASESAALDFRNASKGAAVAALLKLCCVASTLPDAQDGAAAALRAIRAAYEAHSKEGA